MNTEPENLRIETATIEDLAELTDLVMSLLEMEADFSPDKEKQRHGLRLILEQPGRGRIFVLRNDHKVIGMVNLLITISTAEGGFVILMEDVIVRPEHRGHGYGTRLVNYVKEFAQNKNPSAAGLFQNEAEAMPLLRLVRFEVCFHLKQRHHEVRQLNEVLNGRRLNAEIFRGSVHQMQNAKRKMQN